MRCIVAGQEGNALTRILGTDFSLPLLLIDDDGTHLSLAAATLVAEFSTSAIRGGAVVSKTPVARAGVLGFADLTIANAEATLTRQTYYVWVKATIGGVVSISSSPFTLQLI